MRKFRQSIICHVVPSHMKTNTIPMWLFATKSFPWSAW